MQGFFLEIFEGAVFAHGDNQIWHQLALADIAFDSLRLDIYTAYKLHLRDHTLGFFLPVEDIHQLIVCGIHRPVDQGVRLFSFGIELCLGGLLSAGSHGQLTGPILLQFKQSMQRLRHIVLAGVVHKVKDHKAFLSLKEPHTAAQLLGIEHLGHGRTSHEQHLGLRTVPTLIEQITGTEHLNLTAHELILKLLAF